MVQLAKYLTSTTTQESNGTLPILNSLFIEHSSLWDTLGNDNAFKQFMMWARRTPQLMGFMNIIATDILSDKIIFDPLPQNRSTGRNRKMRAQEFWEANNGVDVVEQIIYDLLITGIGYAWVGKIDKSIVRKIAQDTADSVFAGASKETREAEAAQLYEKTSNGEINTLAKKLRHVPSTTMSIKNDQHEVIGYVQRVGTYFKHYDTDEIITFRLMPLDGKPYPFAPVESILAEIYLMWLITQNYVSLFENGGSPDKVFILPEEIAGSKNHEYLISTLRKYKKIQNKHGNLVFTGDLKVEDLMKYESTMEHKDLSLYIVGVMAMLYGMPVGRIPFLLGKAASGGDSGGLADSGYWRKMSVWQAKLENGFNPCLWKPYFGVTARFARGYMQDEVREVDIETKKTEIAISRIQAGFWTEEIAAQYLGIDPEDVQAAMERKKERDDEAMQQEMQKMQADNAGNVMREPDAKLKAKTKQETQLKNAKDAGGKRINP